MKSHQAEIDQLVLSKDVSFSPSNSEKGMGKDVASAEGQTPKPSHCFIAHTPGPWECRIEDDCVCVFKEGLHIDKMIYEWTASDRARANAAFIVKAVNAHDDLLAALKGVVSAADEVLTLTSMRLENAIHNARAAIKKAESHP